MATKRDRIADDLRREIASGRLAPGDRLPIEAELMQRYSVSRSSVRWAMARLRSEGLIRIEQGHGTFVENPEQQTERITRYSPNRLAIGEQDANRSAHLHDAGHRTATAETRVYFEHATADVANQLGINHDDEVTVRSRVMSINGEATQIAVSRLPRAITLGTQLENTDTGPGGMLARLRELGHTLGRPTERVTITRATYDEARTLNVDVGSPLFRIVRTQPDVHGQILEVNEMTLSSRYELVYEIPTD